VIFKNPIPFMTAVMLAVGNLSGLCEVSWWVVALVWPMAPLIIYLLATLAPVLTALPYWRR
jgi:hypothetical protein